MLGINVSAKVKSVAQIHVCNLSRESNLLLTRDVVVVDNVVVDQVDAEHVVVIDQAVVVDVMLLHIQTELQTFT